MKKTIILLINFLLTVLSFLIALDSYIYQNNTIMIIALIFGIIFGLMNTTLLIYNLYKGLTEKNYLKISLISFSVYVVSYFIHVMSSIFNINEVLNLFLITTYLSLYNLVMILIMVFRYWLIKKLTKNNLYFYAINITIIIALALGIKLFDNIPIFVSEIVVFLYYTSVILIIVNISVFIMYKIIKPIEK